MKMILCPECNGSGETVGYFPIYAPDVPKEKRKPTIKLKCLICLGEGRVSEGYEERVKRGLRSTQIRIENDLALREFCIRFDATTVELSRYERGCELPEDTVRRIESALAIFEKKEPPQGEISNESAFV